MTSKVVLSLSDAYRCTHTPQHVCTCMHMNTHSTDTHTHLLYSAILRSHEERDRLKVNLSLIMQMTTLRTVSSMQDRDMWGQGVFLMVRL